MWSASEISAELNWNLLNDGTRQVNWWQYRGHHWSFHFRPHITQTLIPWTVNFFLYLNHYLHFTHKQQIFYCLSSQFTFFKEANQFKKKKKKGVGGGGATNRKWQ